MKTLQLISNLVMTFIGVFISYFLLKDTKGLCSVKVICEDGNMA